MTSMQTIQIEAFDTLFFKDGKPFSMGEDTWADGIFPPPPSVIYGALRTTYAAAHPEGITFGKQGNVDEKTARLEIHSIYYRINGNNYLPLPADMVEKKNKSKGTRSNEAIGKKYAYNSLAFTKATSANLTSSLSSDLNGFFQYAGEEEVESVAGGLLGEENLRDYLSGSGNGFSGRLINDFFETEPKIGIGRNNLTNAAADGQLYRVGMRRPNGLDIRVTFSGLNLLEKGILKLGAEMKAAKYRQIDTDKALDLRPSTPIETQFLKVYLATPGLFEQGYPDLEKLGIAGATFLGRANSRPIPLGGFDMKQGKPKPMLQLFPAGSVFVFELPETVELTFHSQGIKANQAKNSEIARSLDRQGFGICYLGTQAIAP